MNENIKNKNKMYKMSVIKILVFLSLIFLITDSAYASDRLIDSANNLYDVIRKWWTIFVILLLPLYMLLFWIFFRIVGVKKSSALFGLYFMILLLIVSHIFIYYSYKDEIQLRKNFKHLCETQAIYKIYDQETYDKYKKYNSYPIYTKSVSELSKLKEKYPNIDKRATSAYAREREGEREFYYIHWTEDSPLNGTLRYRQRLDRDTGKIIEDMLNFSASGGWLCSLNNPSGFGCSLGSCWSNKYGQYKDK